MSITEQLNTAEKFIAVVAAAGLGFTTFQSNRIQNDVSQQNRDMDAQKAVIEQLSRRQELELARSEKQNALTHQIFQEFVAAVTDRESDPAARIDRLGGVLVLTYAIPDPLQKEGMGNAITQAINRLSTSGVNPERVAAVSFDAQELLVRATIEQKIDPPPTAPAQNNLAGNDARWSNYDFDVFYCDQTADTPRLKGIAGEMLDFKLADKDAVGRWRVRPLPVGVNQRPGYNVRGAEVRYSSADEKPLAERLKGLFEKRYPGLTMTLKPASQNTPWYLSAFVCPAVATAPVADSGG
ncbi:hypothetical protein [Lysobacter fragariae]